MFTFEKRTVPYSDCPKRMGKGSSIHHSVQNTHIVLLCTEGNTLFYYGEYNGDSVVYCNKEDTLSVNCGSEASERDL